MLHMTLDHIEMLLLALGYGGGATVEEADLVALLPWIDWAFS